MVFIPKQITNGSDTICLPAEWYSSACALRKLVFASFNDTGSSAYRIAWDFAGRGKHGASCAYTETYRTFASSAPKLCGKTSGGVAYYYDVWQAWIDGIWTSSTTILVYCDYSAASTKVLALGRSEDTADPFCGEVCKTISIGTPDVACPTSLKATATIYDDGTYTLT